MRIENEDAAFAFRPIADVLANQVLQKLGFARASAAANIEMLVALRFGKGKRGFSPAEVAQNEIIAARRAHEIV
jgi:hypothetical protein